MFKKFNMLITIILGGIILTNCSTNNNSNEYSSGLDEYKVIVHGETDAFYSFMVGDQIEIAPINYEEYDFEGMFTDPEYNNPFELEQMPNHDIDLYPKYTEVQYTIHFETKSEQIIDDVVKTKKQLSDYKLTDGVKEGYSFIGWFTDEDFIEQYSLSNINKNLRNINLFAKYSINPYIISLHVNENIYKYVFDYGEPIKLPDTNEDHYKFNGYYSDEELLNPFNMVNMPSHNLDVFADLKYVNKLIILSNNNKFGSIVGETTQYLGVGEECSIVTAVPSLGYKFKSWSNGETSASQALTIQEDTILFANFSIDYLELPVMEINTDNGLAITSKEDYVGCKVSISNSDYIYCFDEITGKIKGRGNSTWGMPKKPYKLKFDSKVDLFGNGKAKTWTLIANYCDPSLVRNYFAYEIGRAIGSDYCTTTQFIELYLNNEYQGVYLVCEQNEVGKTRVNIDESYDNVNCGYLLELDGRSVDEGIENIDYFKIEDMVYAIKSPDSGDERFSVEFVDFIKNYLYESIDALNGGNIDTVKEYVDITSFAKSLVIHELFKSVDFGWTSFYLYRDKNGLLKSGPVWDFDISSGNCNYVDNDNYDNFFSEGNFWYRKLLNYDEFNDEVKNVLVNYKDEIISIVNDCNDIASIYGNSFTRNFSRWKTMGVYVWPNPVELVEITTVEGQISYLHDWLLNSFEYMYNHFVA